MITDNIICYVPYIYNTYYFTGIGSHLATIILIWTFNALVYLRYAIFVSIIRKRFHELDKNSFLTYIQRRIQEFKTGGMLLDFVGFGYCFDACSNCSLL